MTPALRKLLLDELQAVMDRGETFAMAALEKDGVVDLAQALGTSLESISALAACMRAVVEELPVSS